MFGAWSYNVPLKYSRGFMVWRLVHNFGLELEKEYHHFSSLLPFPSPPCSLSFRFRVLPCTLCCSENVCLILFFYFDSLMEKEGRTRPDFDFRISMKSNNEVFSSLTYIWDSWISTAVLNLLIRILSDLKNDRIEKLFAENQTLLNFRHEFQARELKSRLFHSVFGSWQ